LCNLGHRSGRYEAEPGRVVVAIVLVQATFGPDVPADGEVERGRHLTEDHIEREPSLVEAEPGSPFRESRSDWAVPSNELLGRDNPPSGCHPHRDAPALTDQSGSTVAPDSPACIPSGRCRTWDQAASRGS